MSADVRRAGLAVLLAALLVASAAAGGVSAQAQTTPPQPPESMPTSTADDVYVADSGEVVYVYDTNESAEDSADAQFGMSVEENLVYMLLTDAVDSPPSVTWNVSALAQPESLTAEGNLTTPRPNALQSLNFSFTGAATPENSRSDLDLTARIGGNGGYGSLLQSMTTDGEFTMGPDRLFATGTFSVQTAMPMGQSSSSSLTFQEVSDGYELSVAENRIVSSFRSADWQNESAARETIREQYVPGDESQLSGSATVSLDEYSLTNATQGQRLDTSYTVTYTDMDESLEELIATQLSQTPGASGDSAQRLAEELLAANVEEVSYAVSTSGGSVTGNATLAVTDYEGLALAYFEYAQEIQPDAAAAGSLDQARAQFEAQQAAGLEQTYTWNGSVQGSQDGALSVDFALDYRTSNWPTYVDELQSRDVPWSESHYALNASTEGEQVTMDGSMSLEGAELWTGTLGQFGDMGTGDETAPDLGQALVDSQPQTARLVGSYDADGLRVEAGAAFGNLTVLRDAVADAYDVPRADEVVARNGTGHVRVSGAVSGDATESDVRALPTVGEDTTIHMPGTWDREFQSMDVEQANAFLNTAGSSGPGFGVVVALVALLAVAALAARRP